jgi:hypothetical protein
MDIDIQMPLTFHMQMIAMYEKHDDTSIEIC